MRRAPDKKIPQIRVGDMLYKNRLSNQIENIIDPEPCRVIYVNEKHHYYTVAFFDGIKESFGIYD